MKKGRSKKSVQAIDSQEIIFFGKKRPTHCENIQSFKRFLIRKRHKGDQITFGDQTYQVQYVGTVVKPNPANDHQHVTFVFDEVPAEDQCDLFNANCSAETRSRHAGDVRLGRQECHERNAEKPHSWFWKWFKNTVTSLLVILLILLIFAALYESVVFVWTRLAIFSHRRIAIILAGILYYLMNPHRRLLRNARESNESTVFLVSLF